MTTDFKQTNTAVRYQYVRSEHDQEYGINDDPFPTRDTWEEAAADAIEAGRAEWINKNELRLVSGEIKRVRE